MEGDGQVTLSAHSRLSEGKSQERVLMVSVFTIYLFTEVGSCFTPPADLDFRM